MEDTPGIGKCANPHCEASFLRLGEGLLTVFSVEDPGTLGLPSDTRQKVVWLCDRCAQHKYVHYDREHNRIRVLEAPPRRHCVA